MNQCHYNYNIDLTLNDNDNDNDNEENANENEEDNDLFIGTLTDYYSRQLFVGVDVYVFCNMIMHYDSIVRSLRDVEDRSMARVLLKAYERDFFNTVAKEDMDVATYRYILSMYKDIVSTHVALLSNKKTTEKKRRFEDEDDNNESRPLKRIVVDLSEEEDDNDKDNDNNDDDDDDHFDYSIFEQLACDGDSTDAIPCTLENV